MRASSMNRCASLVRRPMLASAPGIVQHRAERGTGRSVLRRWRAARPPSTLTSWCPRPAGARERLGLARRVRHGPRLSAWSVVSPASSARRSRPASNSVRKGAEGPYGSGRHGGAEEAWHRVAVARSGRLSRNRRSRKRLARSQRSPKPTAAVAGGAVQEVLLVGWRPGRRSGRTSTLRSAQARQDTRSCSRAGSLSSTRPPSVPSLSEAVVQISRPAAGSRSASAGQA